MTAVDVSSEIVITCPRKRVASYAMDPDNVPHWYANIRSVEWLTPRPAVVGSRIAFKADFLGRRLEYTYEIVELFPGERLIMRTSEGPFPMETSYFWEEIDEARTKMTLRNRGKATGFSKLMTPLLSTMMRRANRKDLELLKEILEAGTTRQSAPQNPGA